MACEWGGKEREKIIAHRDDNLAVIIKTLNCICIRATMLIASPVLREEKVYCPLLAGVCTISAYDRFLMANHWTRLETVTFDDANCERDCINLWCAFAFPSWPICHATHAARNFLYFFFDFYLTFADAMRIFWLFFSRGKGGRF